MFSIFGDTQSNGKSNSGNGKAYDHVVEVKDVVKSFPVGDGEVTILKGLSFDVKDGEFVSIVGPSGNGKSTLLNMITGIDRPTRGDVWVAGQRLNDMSENKLARFRGRHVGVIFQFFQLLPTLTVGENVMMPMDLCGVGKRHERREQEGEGADRGEGTWIAPVKFSILPRVASSMSSEAMSSLSHTAVGTSVA